VILLKTAHLDEVLNNCPYYDDIINYTPEKGDDITKDMIRYYQDYVFFNWNQFEKLKKIDMILNEYIKNIRFQKYIRRHFQEVGDALPVYDILESLYTDYQSETMKKVDNTRWI